MKFQKHVNDTFFCQEEHTNTNFGFFINEIRPTDCFLSSLPFSSDFLLSQIQVLKCELNKIQTNT